MNNRELVEKWLSVFGKGVDKKLIEDHEARSAFDNLEYAEAIRFYDGYSNHIEGVSVVDKISAKRVDKDKKSDVYIVAKDFSWTYVRTHELGLGPYLCIKK